MENLRYGCVDERLPIPGTTSGIIWRHQGNRYEHPRHRHSALEMNLVVSGRGCYEIDGRRHALIPGAVLWIRPGESHHVEERTEDFLMWIVAAERPLLKDLSNPELHRDLFPEHSKYGLMRTIPVDEFTWLEREVRRTYELATGDFLRAGIA
jgi:hypothetical protein